MTRLGVCSPMGNVIEIEVKVRDQASAETAAIAEKIRAQMKAATESAGGAATVTADLDDEGLRAKVIEAVRTAERNIAVIVGIDLEDEGLRAKVIEAVKAAERGINVIVGADVDADGLRERVKAETEAASTKTKIKVPIEVPKEDFEAEFRKAMDEGEQASAKASAEIRRSFTAIESGSRSLRAAMAELEPASRRAGAGLEGVGRSAQNAGKNAESSGLGFSAGAARMSLMVGAAFALAPALAALPAAAGAAAAGVGAMALGLGGVIKALHDYGAASAGGGQTAAQMAATAFSNAVAIKNAEQAIADAKKQAARSAEDSAEQIKNAEQGVADAEREAAAAAQSSADQIASAQRSVADAAYSLAQAEQRLQDAEKSELDAQKALTQAREDAANQLQDLNNSAADSHLAVERATLNVAKAQENLAKVLGSSLATDDQKKDAALALKEAQQALIDAKQRDVEATQKADAANKSGVDGMQQVVSAQDAVAKAAGGVKDAQHGVTQAQQAQTDAQLALVRAMQAAANQQVTSAQSVAKAEQALADAQRSADRQRQDSMESVAKAEQNLADTYKQQKLAADAAASAGGGAADKFAEDMAKLTPAGRAFVNQLLSMRDSAKRLSDTAQTAMLPGLTQMLKDSGPMLPIFNGAIDKMGHIIGDTATQFGKLMQSPAFQGQLTKVLDDGAGLAQKFGDGLAGMTGGVIAAASKAGPIVRGLGDGIKTLMTSGVPDFFNGLVNNASGIGQAFQGVLTLVSNLLGPVGTVAGAVTSALAPGIQVLASPQVKAALDSVGQSLAKIIIALSPLITLFAQGLAGALRLVAPLLSTVADFLQENHSWLTPLVKILGLAAVAFLALANPLLLSTALLIGLADGVKYVWNHFSEFLGLLKKWWQDLLALFKLGVSEIAKLWDSAVDFVKKIPGRLASAAAGIWKWLDIGEALGKVSKGWDTLVKTVTDLPGRAAKAGAGLFHWIRQEFLEAVNGIASLWNALKFSTPSFHIPIPFTDGINVDSITVGVPQIGPFKAAGGPTAGGLSAIIGERGWEPLRLPNGTTVVPHANAQQMLADASTAGSTRGGAVELHWVGPAGDELFTLIKRWIRVNYGSGPDSVQRALGQA